MQKDNDRKLVYEKSSQLVGQRVNTRQNTSLFDAKQTDGPVLLWFYEALEQRYYYMELSPLFDRLDIRFSGSNFLFSNNYEQPFQPGFLQRTEDGADLNYYLALHCSLKPHWYYSICVTSKITFQGLVSFLCIFCQNPGKFAIGFQILFCFLLQQRFIFFSVNEVCKRFCVHYSLDIPIATCLLIWRVFNNQVFSIVCFPNLERTVGVSRANCSRSIRMPRAVPQRCSSLWRES